MTATVVVTCYNQAGFIGQAVNSVRAQTAPTLLVVVDDGSTDDSAEVLEELSVEAVRVTNRGMAAARNAGLFHVKTEWVAFLDGDDWLKPDWIEKCLAVADGADAVMSGYREIHADGPRPVFWRKPVEAGSWRDHCHGNSTALLRRSLVVEAGGFHPGVGYDCDWDLWIDLVDRGARIAYADTFYNYRIHPGNQPAGPGEERDRNIQEMRRHALTSP